MPVKPHSDLPIRIARACSDKLERVIRPDTLYTPDNTPVEQWHSRVVQEIEGSSLYENRRITCCNLVYDLPPNAGPQYLELSDAFSRKDGKPKFTIARLAIHEVHTGWEHNFEGQTEPTFCLTDHDWRKKVGIEISTYNDEPLHLRRLENGNVSVLPHSEGIGTVFEPRVAKYDPKLHGDRIVAFARDYVFNNFTLYLPQPEQVRG